jgi:hypothetical protein
VRESDCREYRNIMNTETEWSKSDMATIDNLANFVRVSLSTEFLFSAVQWKLKIMTE